MIIGIRATQIGPGGGLTHLVQCLHWFGRLAPEDQFILYGHADQEMLLPPAPPNVTYRLFRTPARGLLARLVWEGTRLPFLLAQDRLDILLEPGNYAVPNPPCPNVILIHSLAPFVPQYVKASGLYQKMRLNALRGLTLSAIKNSAGTIFLSEHSRQSINPLLKSVAGPSVVIYHGIPDSTQAIPGDDAIGATPPVGEQCILCVSHIYRYKGILELVKGYALAVSQDRTLPDLVIAGALYDKAYVTEIRRFLDKHEIEHRVHLIGSVEQSQLQRLYKSCRFFAFPSTIESASVILLEALASHCAIACSNVSVMPEVCGDAAVYFDPREPQSICTRLLQLHQSESLRTALSRRASKRAADFSWQTTAQQTLDFLHSVQRSADPKPIEATTRTLVSLIG